MPLTPKGNEIKKAMQKEYGDKKGESVFYASRNTGKISGVESACNRFNRRMAERHGRKRG